jgi:hypothetical protein
LAAAVLAALRELMQLAPAVAAVRWAHEERATVISHLDRLTTQATVYRGQLLTAHKEDGRWARSGDRTFENHRGRMTAAGTGAARAEMELADGLAALPTAARAVGEEQFSLGHARELTRLRARAGDGVRRALEEHAEELVALARGVDAPAYGKRLGAWAAAIDAAAAEPTFEAVRARRCLRLAERDGGDGSRPSWIRWRSPRCARRSRRTPRRPRRTTRGPRNSAPRTR